MAAAVNNFLSVVAIGALLGVSCTPLAKETEKSEATSLSSSTASIPLSPEMTKEINNCLATTSQEECETKTACSVITDPRNSNQKICSHRWLEIRANGARCGGPYDYFYRLPFISKANLAKCSPEDTPFVAMGSYTDRLGNPAVFAVALDDQRAPIAEGTHSCGAWSLEHVATVESYKIVPNTQVNTETQNFQSENGQNSVEVPEILQLCGTETDLNEPKPFQGSSRQTAGAPSVSQQDAKAGSNVQTVCPAELDMFECGQGEYSGCRYDTSQFPAKCVKK